MNLLGLPVFSELPVDSLTGNSDGFIFSEEVKVVEALREIPFEDYKRIISMIEASVYYG